MKITDRLTSDIAWIKRQFWLPSDRELPEFLFWWIESDILNDEIEPGIKTATSQNAAELISPEPRRPALLRHLQVAR